MNKYVKYSFLLAIISTFVFGAFLLDHKFDQRSVTPLSVTTKTSDSDIPQDNDKIMVIGSLANGSKLALDISSGNYDENTGISSFLVIQILAQDSSNIFAIVTRTEIDCKNESFRIDNRTAIDQDNKPLDYVAYPDATWYPIEKKNEQGGPTALGYMMLKVCPVNYKNET